MKKPKAYVVEGAMIVFSVLFALFINNSFENYKQRQDKNIATTSILNELHRNKAILSDWRQHHGTVLANISGVLSEQNDTLRSKLLAFDHFNFGVLTNNAPLIDAVLTNTAWETTKTTGIITEFDFSTIQTLTYAYTMQSVLDERTITNILDYYFQETAHDMTKVDQTLIQLQLRFAELVNQEDLVISMYDNAIKELSN